MSVLRLITDRAWMRNELAANTVTSVAASFGLEIPTYAQTDAWWIPQGIGTRFLLNGVPLHAQAPGPRWLSNVPPSLRGRGVQTLTYTQLRQQPKSTWHKTVFSKFAEAKVDWFPGELRTTEEALALLAAHEVPEDAMLQLSTPVDLCNEYRFFVLDGRVVTGSPYLVRHDEQVYTYYDLLDDPKQAPNPQEQTHLETWLTRVLPEIAGPDGYVIDVALDAEGEPLILEANPAWCSAWYGCDIDEVVRTVLAAHRPASPYAWQPDPYLLQHYSDMRPLPRA